jgi:anti-sigma factor RsiW
MMDHVKATDRMTDYVLGEGDTAERERIHDHIRTCQECSEAEIQERMAIECVERAMQLSTVASKGFADRVLSSLPEKPCRSAWRAYFPERRILAVFAVAAAMVIVASFFVVVDRFSRAPKLPVRVSANGAIVRLSMADLLGLQANGASYPIIYQSESSDPRIAAAALSVHVGFPVTPADLSAMGARFTTARMTTLDGRRVALSVMRYGANNLTLAEFDGKSVELPKLSPMSSKTREVLCGGEANCRMVAWKSRGRIFAIIGNIPDPQLIALAGAIPDAEPGPVSRRLAFFC